VGQRNKVLVVEDDEGIRQSLFETLGALGFVVGEAGNGEEALVRLRMVNYDAVLLDIICPEWAVWKRAAASFKFTPVFPSSCSRYEIMKRTRWKRLRGAHTTM